LIVPAAVLSLMVSSVAAAQKAAPKSSEAPAAGAAQEMKPRPKKKRRPKASAGIPKGVQACIDRLIEIASADPLPAYGGQAEEIINGGLLWNDPKSKCSVGQDQSLRNKVSAVATAWREKNADKVRSLLQELKSAAPQG
jgi:hypothetical protein